jgi:hypothetical protein
MASSALWLPLASIATHEAEIQPTSKLYEESIRRTLDRRKGSGQVE